MPGVDIFVCTADPGIEPPIMVINTVLSVMAYNFPSQKLSVYLSDDAGSDLTFHALLEASRFSKLWLPFCRKFNIEPRSPAAYFSSNPQPNDHNPSMPLDWFSVKVHIVFSVFSFFQSHTTLLPKDKSKSSMTAACMIRLSNILLKNINN